MALTLIVCMFDLLFRVLVFDRPFYSLYIYVGFTDFTYIRDDLMNPKRLLLLDRF